MINISDNKSLSGKGRYSVEIFDRLAITAFFDFYFAIYVFESISVTAIKRLKNAVKNIFKKTEKIFCNFKGNLVKNIELNKELGSLSRKFGMVFVERERERERERSREHYRLVNCFNFSVTETETETYQNKFPASKKNTHEYMTEIIYPCSKSVCFRFRPADLNAYIYPPDKYQRLQKSKYHIIKHYKLN